MPKVLNIDEFLSALDATAPLLLDARSPTEFKHAHIPGAFSVPLLNDEHRHEIGITFKKEGREAAVEKGFDLVGPLFGEIIRKVKGLSNGNEVFIYCWRGGMRSGIMAWLLEMSGLKVTLLKGGYKVYRSVVLQSLSVPRKIIILGGKTGSGKTELLQHLADSGEQVIDLEKLACHKGSSFGALGQNPQPSNEMFENLIFSDLRKQNPGSPLWLENESRSIGSAKIPDALFDQMRTAAVVEAEVPIDIRKSRILSEYGEFPVPELRECTARLEKRLGGLRMKQAIEALESNRKSEWLDYLLEYYDETYSYGMSLRDSSMCTKLALEENETYKSFALRLKEMNESVFQNKTA